MAKAKPTVARTQERLSTHKFDTTGYIVMDTGIHRDSSTGRLISHRDKSEAHKPQK
jgi:hypothetical protein